MRQHLLPALLPLLVGALLGGCSSSTPDASSTNASGDNTTNTANTLSSSPNTGTAQTVAATAVPPLAPPPVLADLVLPALPDTDDGHRYTQLLSNTVEGYNSESKLLTASMHTAGDALSVFQKTSPHAPDYTEYRTAERNVIATVDEANAHAQRLQRFMGASQDALAQLSVPDDFSFSRTAMRGGCESVRDGMQDLIDFCTPLDQAYRGLDAALDQRDPQKIQAADDKAHSLDMQQIPTLNIAIAKSRFDLAENDAVAVMRRLQADQ